MEFHDKHGQNRPAANRTVYSNQVRIAVLTEIEAGGVPAEVARKYGVPKSTVRYWFARWVEERRTGALAVPAQVVLETMQEELLAYIRETMDALREQMRVFGDGEWIRQHSLGELSVLHMAIADRFARMVEQLTQQAGAAAPVAEPDEPSFPLDLPVPGRDRRVAREVDEWDAGGDE